MGVVFKVCGSMRITAHAYIFDNLPVTAWRLYITCGIEIKSKTKKKEMSSGIGGQIPFHSRHNSRV